MEVEENLETHSFPASTTLWPTISWISLDKWSTSGSIMEITGIMLTDLLFLEGFTPCCPSRSQSSSADQAAQPTLHFLLRLRLRPPSGTVVLFSGDHLPDRTLGSQPESNLQW